MSVKVFSTAFCEACCDSLRCFWAASSGTICRTWSWTCRDESTSEMTTAGAVCTRVLEDGGGPSWNSVENAWSWAWIRSCLILIAHPDSRGCTLCGTIIFIAQNVFRIPSEQDEGGVIQSFSDVVRHCWWSRIVQEPQKAVKHRSLLRRVCV